MQLSLNVILSPYIHVEQHIKIEIKNKKLKNTGKNHVIIKYVHLRIKFIYTVNSPHPTFNSNVFIRLARYYW